MQVICMLEHQRRPRSDQYTWKGQALEDAYTFLKISKLICSIVLQT